MARVFKEKRLVLATHNNGKIQEFKHLFGNVCFEILSAKNFAEEGPIETENTFLGNALIKAKETSMISGCVSLADDSGLCVDALGGKPGIKSADWSINSLGERDFDLGIKRVIKELNDKGSCLWSAHFNCAIVLFWPDGHYEQFEEKIEGKIVWPSKGKKGHGYDPIFLPSGFDNTFGQMDRWEKNKISHRGRAVDKLIKACFSHEQ